VRNLVVVKSELERASCSDKGDVVEKKFQIWVVVALGLLYVRGSEKWRENSDLRWSVLLLECFSLQV
jgi:hypothetical protein